MSPICDLEPAFVFLSALRMNNRKDWFDPRKFEYEAARDQFACLLETVIAGLSDFDELRGVEPRKCIQRIYRDLRFSKDKSPYHTVLAASLPAWKQRENHLPYYIHLEPGGKSMLAGGLYAPTPVELARFRAAAARDAAALKIAIDAPAFKTIFGELRGESLKNVPREYPRDHPEADWIRRKEVVAIHPLSDTAVLDENLPQRIIAACRALRPVLLVLEEMTGPPEPG